MYNYDNINKIHLFCLLNYPNLLKISFVIIIIVLLDKMWTVSLLILLHGKTYKCFCRTSTGTGACSRAGLAMLTTLACGIFSLPQN